MTPETIQAEIKRLERDIDAARLRVRRARRMLFMVRVLVVTYAAIFVIALGLALAR